MRHILLVVGCILMLMQTSLYAQTPGQIRTIDDLIAFLKVYHRPLLTDTRLDASLIRKDIPEPLQKVYRELGGLLYARSPRSGSLLSHSNCLVNPDKLELEEGMIKFARENQSYWEVLVKPGDDGLYYRDEATKLRRISDSTEGFLITFCLYEALYSSTTVRRGHEGDADSIGDVAKDLWAGELTPGGRCEFSVAAEGDILYMVIPSDRPETMVHDAGTHWRSFSGSNEVGDLPKDLQVLASGRGSDLEVEVAVRTLEALADPRGIKHANELKDHSDPGVRGAAGEVIRQWDEYLRHLRHNREVLRGSNEQEALKVLKERELDADARTLESVQALTKHADRRIGFEAERCAKTLEPRQQHLAWARASLAGAEPAILVEALRAVGRYADIQSLPAARVLLGHQSEPVRREAAYTVAALEFFAARQ